MCVQLCVCVCVCVGVCIRGLRGDVGLTLTTYTTGKSPRSSAQMQSLLSLACCAVLAKGIMLKGLEGCMKGGVNTDTEGTKDRERARERETERKGKGRVGEKINKQKDVHL